MIALSCTCLQLLGSLPQTCKLLKVQAEPGLKRLAWRFNSVPGHHHYQSLSKPAQNFTPVISHLWLFANCRWRTNSEHDKLPDVDEGRKRVLLIAASILAARKLAQFDGGKRVPATVSAIADAVRWAEEIMKAIDERWPTSR